MTPTGFITHTVRIFDFYLVAVGPWVVAGLAK